MTSGWRSSQDGRSSVFPPLNRGVDRMEFVNDFPVVGLGRMGVRNGIDAGRGGAGGRAGGRIAGVRCPAAFLPGRLAALTANDMPDAQGLTGGNRTVRMWIEAGAQEGSCQARIAAVVVDDLERADRAWCGIDTAFPHQRVDGGLHALVRPTGSSAAEVQAIILPQASPSGMELFPVVDCRCQIFSVAAWPACRQMHGSGRLRGFPPPCVQRSKRRRNLPEPPTGRRHGDELREFPTRFTPSPGATQ